MRLSTTTRGIVTLLCAAALQAQAPSRLTLEQAVNLARKHPSIQAALSGVQASAAGVDLARTAYLPRADFYSQVNRATRNNVFGLILPNSAIPAISGPVRETATSASTWGSAAGLLFSWELFDFGLRKANVSLAQMLQRQAQAGLAATEYEVILAVVDSFVTALAARQAVEAAQANVARLEVFHRTVRALVASELRPGADESRALAELVRARTELTAAEGQELVARSALAEWVGSVPEQLDPGALLTEPPAQVAGGDVTQHPLVRRQTAAIEVARARQQVLEKAWRPHLEVLSAVYGRGSGARLDGTFQGGAAGLAPSTGNWAAGLSVRFPLTQYKETQARRSIEQHQLRSESSRLEALLLRLRTEAHKARAQLEAARRIAAAAPLEVAAARTLVEQAEARYRAGLASVVEVAEAQRLLRQAETEHALARLSVWRALFDLAAAEGNLEETLRRSSR